jgi:hypothetical protein
VEALTTDATAVEVMRSKQVAAMRAREKSKRTLGATVQRPRERIRGAYMRRVCVSTDGAVTMRRAAGSGPRRIFNCAVANNRKTFVCVVPLEMMLNTGITFT